MYNTGALLTEKHQDAIYIIIFIGGMKLVNLVLSPLLAHL